ncbi:alpha/beta hydrolase [Micromonospora sp. PPF5-17]|uniref:Alpha/beta hydrolase n=2 Tax=Micromonosporaceae TaxID=28056 RepID=A0ABX9WIM3_9ACTN|nr:alpha/beta hydrolase [Micromonospora solifontis]NES58049.1 alpha/beta hydrolase [Micromonospora sp. PPF5-6]RNL98423.1 alpha/beta hydrolase [Micromonospora solifontis]
MRVQRRVPLTRAKLPPARLSMLEATPAEVGDPLAIRSVVSVDAGGVPARLYRDGQHDAMPVVLYAHGGGWVMGSVDTHDGLCRHLAAASGWAVLSVDYRLAPEHPYPAAVDDMARALTWLRGPGAARHGLDPRRIAVAGDSSGGHLAAVTARRARDAGIRLAGQLLICPVIDPAADYPALDEYGLDREEMRFFWDAYAPPGTDRSQPDLDPLRADLTGLPPAVVITAELDLLSAEGERYAAGLLAAGVPVTATRYQALIHNFPRKLALFDAAHVALAQLAAALTRW